MTSPMNDLAKVGSKSCEVDAAILKQQYQDVRSLTELLCHPLEPEDYLLQSMTEASPAKWHLAHVTWFFETFVLAKHVPHYRSHNPQFQFLFNSYYESVGARIARHSRGLISRPSVREVYDYRHAVDEQMSQFLSEQSVLEESLAFLITVGLHHEQQHQELLLTDLKHAFSFNPLRPVYLSETRKKPTTLKHKLHWLKYPAAIRSVGHDGGGFAFDNESPRHRVFVEDFEIASRLVTVGEYLQFMEAGGYHSPQYWLSDGWAKRNQQQWEAPLYWEKQSDHWRLYTLHGMRDLLTCEPITHVSYYEADAYARWANARLPTEAEWNVFAEDASLEGNFLESKHLHPIATQSSTSHQIMGDVWEWTGSAYGPYPGYRPWSGSLGEYNGKFMSNQMVLRGGSCVTPRSHVRPSYRNFFPPEARWQFSGFRLARSK